MGERPRVNNNSMLLLKMTEMPNQKSVMFPQIVSLVLFILSSVFAVYLANIALQVEPSITPKSTTTGVYYIFYYIAVALIFSFLLLFFGRRYKLNFLRWLFIALIGLVVFYVWSYLGLELADTYSQYYAMIILAPVITIAALVLYGRWFVVDIAGFFLSTGMAFILGIILGIWAAAIFLAIFAVYDYVSVYKTKHMVGLAKMALDLDLPMLFIFPSEPSSGEVKIELSDDGVKDHSAMALGFGDIAFPGIMVVASWVYGRGIGLPVPFLIFPLIGGAAGMLYLMFGKVKKPAPGLPFLNTGVILGTLLSYLIFVAR
ncbi:MAG: presenilin family intramembrane aspartyl protease PSH [Thermoplasmatales archaeon]